MPLIKDQPRFSKLFSRNGLAALSSQRLGLLGAVPVKCLLKTQNVFCVRDDNSSADIGAWTAHSQLVQEQSHKGSVGHQQE
jgi:hypothetical protein